MHLFSPAKLNIFLKLHGKRADGFHEMTTMYQTIHFGDDLSLSTGLKDAVFCDLPGIKTNLIWTSLRIFREYTHIETPVVFHVRKRIPLESGLGGGSSNAATALYALNAYFDTRLSYDTLIEMAKQIGTDVPLFFSSGTVLGVGRGEELVQTQQADREIYVLYFSYPGVSTQQAFAHVRPEDVSSRDDALEGNDLEKAVFRFRKDLEEKKLYLERIWSPFHGRVSLTGSGGTLFVRYPYDMEQTKAKEAISKTIRDSFGIRVAPLQKSPEWY